VVVRTSVRIRPSGTSARRATGQSCLVSLREPVAILFRPLEARERRSSAARVGCSSPGRGSLAILLLISCRVPPPAIRRIRSISPLPSSARLFFRAKATLRAENSLWPLRESSRAPPPNMMGGQGVLKTSHSAPPVMLLPLPLSLLPLPWRPMSLPLLTSSVTPLLRSRSHARAPLESTELALAPYFLSLLRCDYPSH